MPNNNFIAEVEAAIDEAAEEIMDTTQTGVERGLKYLETNSPVWTGWYQRNHRVSINDENVELDPATKPKESEGTGELAVNNLPDRERPTLEKAELGDIIYVANATPHAGWIEVNGSPKNPAGGWYSKAALVVANKINSNSN